jgi:hypothetical protein
MNISTGLLILLVLDIFSLALLAAFYLRRRQMSWFEYLFWGLLAVLIPIIGPFLVIISKPGNSRDTRL